MKRVLIAASLCLCLPTLAAADAVGINFGAYSWQQEYSGTAQSGTDVLDFNQDLGFDDDTNTSYYVAIEHPIPILPNLKIAHTNMDTTATGNISADFDGVTFDGTVITDSDLTHTDFTLYYELLDNWVSLDLGLTARQFKEGVRITDQTSGETGEVIIDETIPMLYLAVKFDLPLTGLYIGGDANGVSYDDDDLIDYRINVGYESSIGLGIEVGFRSFDLDYEDDDNERVDVTIDGAYATLFFHF